MYRQGIPTLDLWVEQGTSNVPDDGKYHVLHNGEAVSSHARERDATTAYNRLKKELGADAEARPKMDATELLRRERAHHEAQALLAESGRRRGDSGRRKGGKGR